MARMENMVIINTLSILESQRLSYKQDRGLRILCFAEKVFLCNSFNKDISLHWLPQVIFSQQMIFLLKTI